MGDYNYVYRDVEGASKEWDYIYRKLLKFPNKRTCFKPSTFKNILSIKRDFWIGGADFLDGDAHLKYQDENDLSRDYVIEVVQRRLIEKVVKEHEDNNDRSSGD
ncbi:hypothetical protein SADUNF_Sadunf07G0057400 [Salix dunnii]|uniref:Uncharacterized protein n=1 Tax=Salix dunnii TaxID=1413687 RepID=A0A835K3B3_9ROSI|nr:hypothetical protein SADUNF_Sadunf07G0057400 [Salix dunnii]